MTHQNPQEHEILHSQSIKAGKRIYYVDVKKTRNDEMYLTLTESKKVTRGTDEDAVTSFEKHKIFIYREDFDKFKDALQEAIEFIETAQGKAEPRVQINDFDINLDMEFGDIK